MKTLISIFLLSVFTCISASALQCQNLFARLESASSQVSTSKAVSQFKNDLVKSSVRDFLTDDFISKLENELGPVIKTVKFYDTNSNWHSLKSNLKSDVNFIHAKATGYDYALSVNIVAKKSMVMEFIILLNKDLTVAVVENLGLQNPLNKNGKLHLSQSESKGIAMQDFSKSVRYIKSFLSTHQVKKLKTETSQNLLVSFLYRKLVGMKPTEKSAALFQHIDRLLSQKIVSTNELNNSLGDPNSKNDLMKVTSELGIKVAELAHELKDHKSSTPIYIGNELQGYKVLNRKGESYLLFLDPADKKQQTFLTWRSLHRNQRIGLVLDF